MNSINKTARMAGLLYLICGLLGFYSMMYVPSRLVVWEDASATANNIMANELLFRLGSVSNLVSQVVNIFAALVLYKLLKPVNKNMASLIVLFFVVGVPIAMLSELTQFGVLALLSGADYLKVFTTEQLQALVPLLLHLRGAGDTIAQIFWGLWLFPMGYLVYKSGFLPRVLGALLMIGCFGYLIASLVHFLFPDYLGIIYPFAIAPAGIAELAFILWLLIKGVNVEQWEKRAVESG